MAARSTSRPRARTGASAARRRIPYVRIALAVLAVLALAAGAYAAALETSVFAVDRIDVARGPPRLQAELREALAPEIGRSLLRVDSAEIARRTAPIPDLAGVSFDRRFPHTLRIRATAERPVLLLRRGADTWLVSARGRVMRKLHTPKLSSLPRTWVKKGTPVVIGEFLAPDRGGIAAAALAPLPRGTFPSSVRFVRASATELTLVLSSGMEVRLGDLGDLRLKVAIARRLLHRLEAGAATTGYVDVSVPERPVAKSP